MFLEVVVSDPPELGAANGADLKLTTHALEVKPKNFFGDGCDRQSYPGSYGSITTVGGTSKSSNSNEQEIIPDAGVCGTDNPGTERMTILKNIIVVSVCFSLLFTAYLGMANLQTSLNKEEGVGAWGLSTVYISLALIGIHLPAFVIARYGCKWTMAISMVAYFLYIAANFYAIKETIIPASALLGVSSALLWTAKCTYLTQLSMRYATMTKQGHHEVINLFFGIFFFCYQTSQIWGNLTSSLVFTETPAKYDDANLTDSAREQVCGPRLCPEDDSSANQVENNFDQSIEKVYILCSIYLGFTFMAIAILVIFLDKDTSEEDRRLRPKLLVCTVKHLLSSPSQILLVPISAYLGMERAFLGADYTSAYISCSLGIWNVGYVVMCYGVVNAVCSILFGCLARYMGHTAFFAFVFLIHGALLVVLLLWTPQPDQEMAFYAIAGLWGAGDAALATQLNALYSVLFTEDTEAAFANLRLCEALAFAITYAYTHYLCTDIKIYICMALLAAGMAGYALVEIRRRVGASSSDCKDARS